jgi:hypothetical protein
MRKAQLAVRAGADAEVVAELPVVEVVHAAMAGPRERRHLVARQPRRRRALGDEVEHVGCHVVVGQPRRVLGEEGVGLDRQVVDRQVRRLERQRLLQVGLQLGQRLAGQRIHQVEVEGVEGARGLLERGLRLRRVVHTAEHLQLAVVEALHADRQPGDAGLPVAAKAIALEGARIGFQRDLAARFQRQPRAHVGDQRFDALRREQARRAAADEDGVHAASPDERQRRLEVGAQRIEVARLRHAAGRFVRVEVAVRALLQAPREMDVQRQRRQRAQRQRARAQVARENVAGRLGGRRRRRDRDVAPLSQGATPRASPRASAATRSRDGCAGSSRRRRARPPCAPAVR